MNVRSENVGAKRGRGRPASPDMRRRVLDAALTVFADRGFHGTAVPLVAERAGVGTGTLYRYFESKEQLVNEVFRDAKGRLKQAIFDGLDVGQAPPLVFADLWRRLVAFARAEPLTFQFLEMQDHVPYLDADSREAERAVLSPIWLMSHQLKASVPASHLSVEASIAMVWGALVGLLKAERLGYLTLDEATLEQAGAACWVAMSSASELPAPPPVQASTPVPKPRRAKRN